MRLADKILVSLAMAVVLSSGASAATITGSVTGPDGKPFMGAFVVAENTQNKMTVSVLSDEHGRYHIGNLPAAAYTVKIDTVGYKSDPRTGVTLTADQAMSADFALQKGMVLWSDLSTYQGRQLLPKIAKHDLSHNDVFFTTCFQSCHSFQKRMLGAGPLDKQGYRSLVDYMRETMMAEGRPMSDAQADDFASYMETAFGPNSPKPKSPAKMPQYKSLVRSFSPGAMNIVYVEYDFAASKGMGPWSAAEDKDGMLWIPYYGRGNEVVRLNPDTAEQTRFPLSFSKTAGIHSAVPAPDGTVWFTEASLGRIGHLDPHTKKIVEYQNPRLPDGRRTGAHTIRVDKSGMVWVSGGPAISEFDPKQETFKHFDLGSTYGNVPGNNGDQWFTSFRQDGPIGRVKDGVLTTFDPPTKGKPQRLEVDSNGIVWFTERRGNKIGRLDPETKAFKEFPLPGPEASPYAIGIDKAGMIWYSSHEQDTLNRLDPKTGKVTEYPYPHSEISMREFFVDSKGRMWYASSANNKVGYFYFNDASDSAAK
jgi:streptogramin lyase